MGIYMYVWRVFCTHVLFSRGDDMRWGNHNGAVLSHGRERPVWNLELPCKAGLGRRMQDAVAESYKS